MSRAHKQVANSLKFQLSLLRLAVIAHGSPCKKNGVSEAEQLTKLAKSIPATDKKQASIA